jgi:hypothetical protein
MSSLTGTTTAAVSEKTSRFFGLTWWSLLTLVLVIPVWIAVVRSAVLSRIVDGGIFLSVSAGITDGLRLYEQIWDNKDPFFFAVMALPLAVAPNLAFFLDIMWIALGGLGAGMIARSVMSSDRALFVGLVASPILLIGPSYVPGWTNTPGTSLALLTLGLVAHRMPVGAGIAAGLVAFVKLAVWPIAAAGVALLLVFPARRKQATRGLIAMFATMGVAVGVLALLGWLAGAVDALGRNRQYAIDVANYFGFQPSIAGRLARAFMDWAGALTWSAGIALALALVIAVLWLSAPRLRSTERAIVAIWALLSWFGILGMLGFTYVWPHHVQALALPSIFTVILIAGVVPQRWIFPTFVISTLAGTAIGSGWGSVRAAQEAWNERSADFVVKVAEINEEPLDARLLASVTISDFTYARLGSNDDRGFLTSVRPDAQLACPQFHLYDFSPPEAFTEALQCIQNVDVVLLTDAFTVFGGSSRAPYAQPVLDYVGANFTCLRVEDRQVCTRR